MTIHIVILSSAIVLFPMRVSREPITLTKMVEKNVPIPKKLETLGEQYKKNLSTRSKA